MSVASPRLPSEGPVSAAPWRAHLARHLPVAREGLDPEGVHQVRVSAARLRVWLRLAGMRVLSDDLRWLRRVCEEVRDLDVSIALGGPEEFVADLRARWEAAHRQLVVELERPRVEALLDALRHLPPLQRRPVVRRTRRWLERARREGDALDWERAPDEALHTFRRRARRLRYALDWLGLPRRGVKDLAEELGELNDLVVLRERVLRGEGGDGEAPTADQLDERIAAARAECARRWPQLRKALRRRGLGKGDTKVGREAAGGTPPEGDPLPDLAEDRAARGAD